jgi:hypothetical protein
MSVSSSATDYDSSLYESFPSSPHFSDDLQITSWLNNIPSDPEPPQESSEWTFNRSTSPAPTRIRPQLKDVFKLLFEYRTLDVEPF